MRLSYKDTLRRRIQVLTPDPDAYLAVEALVNKGEDVKRRRDEWDAVTHTDLEALDDGRLRLLSTPAAKISHTSSDGFLTAGFDGTRPTELLLWQLDPSIGSNPVLSKVDLWLTRRFNGGQAAFDGSFSVRVYAIANYAIFLAGGTLNDYWSVRQVADAIVVPASGMATDTELVPFSFASSGLNGVPGIVIDGSFRPNYDSRAIAEIFGTADLGGISGGPPAEKFPERTLVVLVQAHGGTNSNYGLGRDSTQAIDKVVAGAGTLRHRRIYAPVGSGFPADILRSWWKASGSPVPSGMPRATLTLGSFPTTATIAFTGASKMSLGAAAQQTVEFVVGSEAPPGTSVVTQARVSGGDPWITVKDGQTPADVGLAVPNPVAYEMQAILTANAAQDTSPSLTALGIRDRQVWDVSEFATLEGFGRSVDPFSGEVKMAEGRIRLQHTGLRDCRDLATLLMSDNDFVDVEFRTWQAHRDVVRSDWLPLNLYRVDDYEDGETELELTCVDVADRLKGQYPQATGNLFGYLLKAAASDLSGGADFNRELTEGAEAGGTIAVSVAASATETSYGFSKVGVPGMAQWPKGSFAVKVNVTIANTNIQLSVAIARVNSAGVQQQISPFTDEQQATAGVKVFQLNNLSWTPGAIGDRLRVMYRFRNTVGSTQVVTIGTGDSNAEAQAPWQPLSTVAPKSYLQQTIQAAYLDWRDGVIGLAERYRGAAPANVTSLVTKEQIADTDGKRELERIAFLDGACPIASQGVVKCVSLQGLRAGGQLSTFSLAEIKPIRCSPGLRLRLPELRVPYGWGKDKPNAFQAEVRFQHATALSKFGVSRIDNPSRTIENDIAKWIPDAGLASQAGEPLIQSLGTGFIVFEFESLVPRPELEIGDPAVVESSTFTLRNPITGAPIRGHLWGLGVIIATGSEDGRGPFQVWIRNLADLFAVTAIVHGRQPPAIPTVQVSPTVAAAATPGSDYLNLNWSGSPSVRAVKIATSTSAQPEAGTGTLVVANSGISQTGPFAYGTTIYVTVTPYSDAGATLVGVPFYGTIQLDRFGSSTGWSSQGSVPPVSNIDAMFTYSTSGDGGVMWVSYTWNGGGVIRRADGTTIQHVRPTPPVAPTVSDVAGGALGSRTYWVYTAYKLNGFCYTPGPSTQITVGANKLLKVTSPPPVAGYDGYTVLVSSVSGADNPYLQDQVPFGTDWTEPSGGFSTAVLAATRANVHLQQWQDITLHNAAASTAYRFYPYWDVANGLVAFAKGAGGSNLLTAADAIAAQQQFGDRHIPLQGPGSIAGAGGSFSISTPASGVGTNGSVGGGRGG